MKKHLTTILLLVVFFIGLAVLGYPAVSNYVNARVQTRVVTDYNRTIGQISNEDYTAIMEAAENYNAQLVDNPDRFTMTPDELQQYNSLLDIDGTGIMGILTIPKVNVTLPIYHGTDPTVLQEGVGHFEGSSLPVGGTSTHAVITGHRGLPSAELLSNIDQLQIGDRFQISILDEVLTYEVDQISVVLPEDTSKLGIEPGQDYVTLVTCTPYGVNTHRLLVRGHRVDNSTPQLNVRIGADALQVSMSLETLIGIILMLGAVITYVLIRHKILKRRS